MKNDGGAFSDHQLHRVLRKKGFHNPEGEWFKCTIADIEAAIIEMVQKAYQVDDAISEACSGMYQAMIEYNNSIQASNNSQELTELSIKALDRMFEYFEVESSYEVPTKVEEIFSVESFEHHHA